MGMHDICFMAPAICLLCMLGHAMVPSDCVILKAHLCAVCHAGAFVLPCRGMQLRDAPTGCNAAFPLRTSSSQCFVLSA